MKDIKKNYITIQGWMIQDLNLKPNEVFVFALIFGFCQDQESQFTGSVKYVCTWLNCSKNTALKAIKSLVEKELIIKTEVITNNVLFNKYSINFKKVNQICTTGSNIERGVQKLSGGSAETERGVVQKMNGGSAETEPNNTNNKNNLNINKNKYKERFAFLFSHYEFEESFNDFVEMRKSMKAVMTERAKELLLIKLCDLTNKDVHVSIQVLNQSILNNWKGIFSLKNDSEKLNNYGKSNNGTGNKNDELIEALKNW